MDKQLMKNRKGIFQLQSLIPAVIMLVVVAIVLAFGALTLSKISSQLTSGAVEYNATQNGLSGLNTASTFLPTIAIVIVAAVIIAILLSAFAVFLATR